MIPAAFDDFRSGEQAASYDYLNLNGTLTLDSGPHTININVPAGDQLFPGTYTLIYQQSNNFNENNSTFVVGTTPAGNDGFTLTDTGFSLLLQVVTPVLQWDPQSTGPSIQEGPGTWTAGSPFFNFTPGVMVDQPWVNGTTQQVLIGNSVTQDGGAITLGSNIVVGGELSFGPIAQTFNYDIVNASGNTFTLTLGGGISVNNTTATSTGGPSGLERRRQRSTCRSFSPRARLGKLIQASFWRSPDQSPKTMARQATR